MPPNVPDEESPLASGVLPAREAGSAGSMSEVPKGRGLSGPHCSVSWIQEVSATSWRSEIPTVEHGGKTSNCRDARAIYQDGRDSAATWPASKHNLSGGVAKSVGAR